jgi:hypothetical protein
VTKNTFTNTRRASWIVIAAALPTFTVHAVQTAKSIMATPKTTIRPLAAAAASAPTTAVDRQLTAAYRDGLYVGKLVAQRGEQRQAPVGRWATQIDRDAFQAGYEQANPEMAEASKAN